MDRILINKSIKELKEFFKSNNEKLFTFSYEESFCSICDVIFEYDHCEEDSQKNIIVYYKRAVKSIDENDEIWKESDGHLVLDKSLTDNGWDSEYDNLINIRVADEDNIYVFNEIWR